MKNLTPSCLAPLVLLSTLLTACATPPAPIDYTAFTQAKPASLLVLPPLNDSTDIQATPGVWANATQPLSEAGYYVLPITLVDETFRQNGLSLAVDIHNVTHEKLRQFFGADAVVYLRVKRYGTTYTIINSDTRVEVEARIVDLRSSTLLWQGTAQASSAEQQQSGGGGLIAVLVTAAVKQIMSHATDTAFTYAGIANQRLLSGARVNGVLPGPRSPLYGKLPGQTAK
jgi:hypothetical protein